VHLHGIQRGRRAPDTENGPERSRTVVNGAEQPAPEYNDLGRIVVFLLVIMNRRR
jgi:hypothetical protein